MNIHDFLLQNKATSTSSTRRFSMDALLQAQKELFERLAADSTGEGARAHAQALCAQRDLILQELRDLIEETQQRKMTEPEQHELALQVDAALVIVQQTLPEDWAQVQAMKQGQDASTRTSYGANNGA